jgi:hypothetical protein
MVGNMTIVNGFGYDWQPHKSSLEAGEDNGTTLRRDPAAIKPWCHIKIRPIVNTDSELGTGYANNIYSNDAIMAMTVRAYHISGGLSEDAHEEVKNQLQDDLTKELLRKFKDPYNIMGDVTENGNGISLQISFKGGEDDEVGDIDRYERQFKVLFALRWQERRNS